MPQDNLENNALYKMFIHIRTSISKNLYQGNFNYEGTIKIIERYLPIAQNMQSDLFLGQVYQSLALIEGEVGHYQTAQEYYEEAIEAYTQEENTERLSVAYCALGEIHRKVGNIETAADCYHQSRNLAESIDYTRLIIYNCCNEGQLWLAKNETEKAITFLEQGLNLVHNEAWDTEYRHQLMPEILSSLGEAYAKIGQNELAWRQSERALELARKENQVHQIARAYQTMALIAIAENMETDVQNFFEESKIHWEKAHATAELGHLAILEAGYWKDRQNRDKLIECYTAAVQYFEATHLDQETANARRLLDEIS